MGWENGCVIVKCYLLRWLPSSLNLKKIYISGQLK